VHALVVASRFGLLLGLALWLGLGAAALLQVTAVHGILPPAQATEVTGALMRRHERVMAGALVLVVLGLGARMILDRAAPDYRVLAPVVAMSMARLFCALAVSPTLRALRSRLRDANAPATDAERAAFGRLEGARRLLLTLEVCLGLYALYAVS
jgi:hypothetical protein